MTTIGFIGLGTMGAPMAGHILDGLSDDDALVLHDHTQGKATALVDRGARWASSPRELAQQSDIVICMVQALDHIRSACNGPDGLLAGVAAPTTLVICSTIAAGDVRELDADLAARSDGRLRVVDAPVSGGEVGARAGTLSIMVGGPDELVAPVLPVLGLTGTAVHLGDVGSGEVAKACNQAIVAATVAAISEASVVAERAGLDVARLFGLLQGGYAGSAVLSDKATRFATHDYSPSGPLWFWVKDLNAYLAEARATGTDSLVVEPILQAVRGLVDAGLGDADTAVMQRWVETNGRP